MSVHRMDFLVDSHQSNLLLEARDQRLAVEYRRAHPPAGTQWGRVALAPMQHALHLARHDLRLHHLHRHHLGQHA